jgi:pimeloyl-ACP methyl ester carboxylesterase
MHIAERKYGPKPTPDETHFTYAKDSWRLAMHRYLPKGGNPHGEPVLLQHGLGSCAKQFDLGVGTLAAPVPSLAHWLAGQGYDVWACDLRGSGTSLRRDQGLPLEYNWSVDDFIEKDSPAFVNYILKETGHAKLHWVGHSLGGILLLAHCALHGSERITSGVVMAGGFDYSGEKSSYDMIEPLKPIGRLIKRVPAAFWGKNVAPLFGRWNAGFETSFFHPTNIAPAARRAIPAGANYDLSGEALYQLATLFKPGGLTSRDGSRRYIDLADRITTPLTFIAGSADRQCSPLVVARTASLVGADDLRFTVVGKAYGQADDYGHFDLVAGLRADTEVFPKIGDWLRGHRFETRAPQQKRNTAA